ncbi:MAG TPA: putative maltokinase [Roseiflexaceae bacterium]
MAIITELPTTALRDVIPNIPHAWLRDRRWFSSKGRTIASITVTDWGAVPLDQPAILAFVLVRYTAGRDEHYVLPLIASPETQPPDVHVSPALTIDQTGTTWYVHDAFQFASFRRLLMELLIAGSGLPLQGGRLVFRPEEALRQAPPPLAEIKLVASEQSNSSIIYDHQAILKCFRRLVAGVNPDVEVSHFLTMRAGFGHTPAMLGSIAYISANGVEHSLGLLQAFARNVGDAWEHALVELGRFLSAVRSKDQVSEDVLVHETQRLTAALLDEIKQLGTLTGDLHVALASDPNDPDFAPRPLFPDQVTAWQTSIRAESNAILGELEQRAGQLPPEQQAAVAALLDARPRIEQRIAQLAALGAAGLVTTRYHGDYHLGQVLVSARGLLILDFEGEPLRSLAERRAHGSPLKDVAGMLRSLSYAAATALIAAEPTDPAEHIHRPLAAWADAWERCARAAFRDGYVNATRGAAFVPTRPALRDAAIAAFELEKALYELNYELNNRPDWLPIPLHGIQRVI